jgi:hypothetical protein
MIRATGLALVLLCCSVGAKPLDPLSLHFEKDYQVRNFFNSSVTLSELDLSQAVTDKQQSPQVHLTSPGCGMRMEGGVLTFRNTSSAIQESYVDIGRLYNYAAIDLDISGQQHDTYTASALLCLYQDRKNRIIIAQRDADADNASISLEIFRRGKSVLSETLSKDGASAPCTVRVHLTGAYLNILSVKDGEWKHLLTEDISPHFDLREKEVLERFSIAAGARLAKGEQVSITRLEQYLTSGTAQADPKVVHYENGAPIIDRDKIWVAMTTRGYGPIPSAYQGVYSYDLKTKEWAVTASLAFNRGDDTLRPWHASDIFYDRTDKKWKVFTVSHGDDHKIYYGESADDLRNGYHEVESELVDYPSVGNEEDPSVIYDADAKKWRMAVCKSNKGYQTVLMEAKGLDRHWKEIAAYTPVSSTGILIQKIGGKRYVFIGRGDTPCPFEVLSYPELQKVGELNLSGHPNGRNVWPVIIPVTRASGTSYYLLTFDRAGLFSGWSYGNIHWYQAGEFADGFFEYEKGNNEIY